MRVKKYEGCIMPVKAWEIQNRFKAVVMELAAA
jgi:hypothetical protein